MSREALLMTPASGHGHLRASHADRERAIGVLKAAYVYGLVTKDEFDARVGRTFASRTYAELAVVTADIPAGLPALPPAPAGAPSQAPAPAATAPAERMLTAATATTAIAAVLALAAALVLPNPAAGLLVIFAAGSAAVTMLLLARLVRGTEQGDKPPGGQRTQLAG
jgi:hypothetical protein